MNNVSDHIERLIVRMLDGEISSDEQLELDRELLRSPQARALCDEYERIDRTAASIIKANVSPAATEARRPVLVVPAAAPVRHRSRGAYWMLAGAALAACLAIVVFVNTPSGSDSALSGDVAQGPRQHRMHQVGIDPATNRQAGLRPADVGVFNVRDITPQPIKRRTDRNMILVPDQDGRLYLINLDHTRQVQRTNESGEVTPDPV